MASIVFTTASGTTTLTAADGSGDQAVSIPRTSTLVGTDIANTFTANQTFDGGVLMNGATTTSTFNSVGGVAGAVVAGNSSSTDITGNTLSNITIVNQDGTLNNTAAVHFAREDTDENPNFVGASVVAQFLETQVTGQYPKSELAFLVSKNTNTAPTEKFRITGTGVTINNGQYIEEYNAVTSSSNATTCDLNDGNNFSHTLTENTTFTFSNPASSGKVSSFTLKIVQDASASGFTVTWPAAVDWAAATAPTLTATADAVDYFVFITHDGGTTWYGFTAGQAMG